jgi:phospholipid/cholesterol/gamma-HCH transport system substrate-binding protein
MYFSMYKKFDLFFGFFVIAVFLWFLWVLTSSVINISINTYTLKASFSSVDGISVGSDVKIAGVKVGEVTEIEVDNKTFIAKAEFKIISKFKIPVDSSASIQSSGLLGGKYIELSPGFEEKDLKDGELISNTQSALNLEKLISTFASSGLSSNKK